MESYMSVLI